MNVSYPDGTNQVYQNVNEQDIADTFTKMKQGKVRSFSVYHVGEIITQPSGDRYEVQRDGSWKKL
jgi:hypothetical protein